MAAMLLACITWYYWGDISPVLNNWFRRPRPGNDGTGIDNTGMNSGLNQPSLDNRPTIEQRFKNLFHKDSSNSDSIELQDNTQKVASGSNIKLEDTPSSSNNSMDHYFNEPKPIESQMTGFKPITGQDFTGESTAVVNEIDTFLNYHDSASFPKAVIASGFYKLLRDRLSKLADLRNNSYKQ